MKTIFSVAIIAFEFVFAIGVGIVGVFAVALLEEKRDQDSVHFPRR